MSTSKKSTAKKTKAQSPLDVIRKRAAKRIDSKIGTWSFTSRLARIEEDPAVLFPLIEETLGEDMDEAVVLLDDDVEKITKFVGDIWESKKSGMGLRAKRAT
jgi:hypothetical protein